MTDGTALVQGSRQVVNGHGSPTGSLSHWFKLTPDNTGSYLNGTWSRVADAITYVKPGKIVPYEPDAGGGAVLADGRLAMVGGEYTGNSFTFTLTNETAVYSPFTNTWTPVVPPLAFGGTNNGYRNFGNSPTTVLPGGNLLVGQKITKRDVALVPKSLTWIQYGGSANGKADFNAEEGFTLLPDGSILTVDVQDALNSERLIPAPHPTGYHWITQGRTPVLLPSPRYACCIPFDHGHRIYNPPGEIGPAILRPDGTVFATGSIQSGNQPEGRTAIYKPTGPTSGTWTAGPNFLPGDDAGDNFGVLEPSGNVLVEGDKFHLVESATVSAMMAKRAQANAPFSTLYEFNGTTFKPLSVGVEPGSSLLPLPSGQVLAMGVTVQIFTPTGTYQQAWAPTISSAPSSISIGGTYKISGSQFNGLSQACTVGDEEQCATNYPLVRITNNATGHVFYARTHDHSTMGVATGSMLVWTYFDVLAGTETGASKLQVVANGIPSKPVSVTVN